MKNLVTKKQQKEYKEYDALNKENMFTSWYAGKGYFTTKESVEDWNYFTNANWQCIWNGLNSDGVTDRWLYLLDSIIGFCKENGIELTLVSAPMSNFYVAGIQNYDEYVELVRNTIADTGIKYYDFNLCREEYFPSTSTLFMDGDHMNCYGAEKFSRLLAELENGEVSEEELFYDTYEEKVRNMAPTVFGISYHDERNDKGELVRNCKIVSTCNDNMEFEIMLAPEDGKEPYILQEFSDDIFFVMNPGEHGACTIRYRLNSRPEEIWTRNISY